MDEHALRQAVHFAQVTRYSHVAALLVYDWLLVIDQEANLVLTSSLSRGKIVYLFCRYWPLLTYPITMWVQAVDHDPAVCARIFRIPMFLSIPNLAGAAGILILRIYAFTQGKRSVALFLVACLAGVIAYQAYIGGAKASLIELPIGCYPVDTGSAKYLSGYFMATLVFDCITTATFAVYAARHMTVAYSEMGSFSQVFIREGAAYFLAISAVNIVNGAMNFQPNIPMATVAVPLSLLLANLLACRLVLNLRSVVADGQDSAHPLSVDSAPRRPAVREPRGAREEYALRPLSPRSAYQQLDYS